MGGIVDAIIGIIEAVIDAIVDLIETIVDIIVDIVDTIVDILAGLLGFDDDKVVEQFEVLNQPLFENPDKNYLTQIVYDSIVAEEDYVANVLYSTIFRNGKKNIRQFTEIIEDGDYFEDFPTVKADIHVVDYDEVDDILTTLESTAVTVDTARLGSLFVPTWIKYWLQVNKSYNHANSTFVHSGTTYTVNVFDAVYNGGSAKDYTLRLGSPLANFNAFTIPAKATGLHYIVSYHRDNAQGVNKSFVYKVGAGTYSSLDDPSEQFGESGGGSLDILPAIPLRLNNTNFNASATTKSAQITALVDKIGLDASDLIDSVMEDVATAGVSNVNTKVDHVYLNFGVRLWETSQIGLNYLFRFISTLYPGQASTEGNYNAAPDDKPYNSLLVTGGDYKYAFTFAYIKFNTYSLAQVNASSSSTIFSVYYSDLTKFASGSAGNSDLITNGTYYASSGYGTYAVGYITNTTAQVNAFVAGTLSQQSSFNSEAANWMQPTKQLAFSGILVNADNTTNTGGVIKPASLYERLPAANVAQVTGSTTYQITAGSTTISIQLSGGGGGGGGGNQANNAAGSAGGATVATVKTAAGSVVATFTANGGSGGGHVGGQGSGTPGQSFGGPGSNGVPSGAHSSFSGTGGATAGIVNPGSNASGKSAGGGGAGYGSPAAAGAGGSRGQYQTFNYSVGGNYTYVIEVSIGNGGNGGGVGSGGPANIYGGNGASGTAVLSHAVAANGLQLINRAAETTTASQEMIYYQIVQDRLNSYTLKAPKSMLRVVDAQTSKFKMVNFNLANINDLMLPFSYEMVKDLPNRHVSSLFLAAAHISIYVADVQVITLPIWAKLLKIVQVVLFIMALLGAVGIKELLNVLIKEVLKDYIIKAAMQALIKLDPKLAIVAMAVMAVYGGGGIASLDFGKLIDIVKFLGKVANLIGNALELLALEDLEDLNQEDKAQKILQQKQMDALYEVQQSLLCGSDNPVNLAVVSVVHRVNPMSPAQFISTSVDDFCQVGFAAYDYENAIGGTYEQEEYS